MQKQAALLEKLLSYKEQSPLIAVFDNCSQSAQPVLKEFQRRAELGKRHLVYVAFEDCQETRQLKKNFDYNVTVVRCLRSISGNNTLATSQRSSVWLKPLPVLLQEVHEAFSSKPQNTVVIIDCITSLFLEPTSDPIHFLGSILSLHPISIIFSHHLDVALPQTFPHYPSAESLLSQISTTILRVSSFDQHIIRLEAESQALPDPIDKDADKYGVISAIASNCRESILVAIEYRKKSGRIVTERCVLKLEDGAVKSFDAQSTEGTLPETNIGMDFGTTFNLGMTQEQKRNKEIVVLPHFAAQSPRHNGPRNKAGTEIEYTLGAEDDFDDEEDVDEDLLI